MIEICLAVSITLNITLFILLRLVARHGNNLNEQNGTLKKNFTLALSKINELNTKLEQRLN